MTKWLIRDPVQRKTISSILYKSKEEANEMICNIRAYAPWSRQATWRRAKAVPYTFKKAG